MIIESPIAPTPDEIRAFINYHKITVVQFATSIGTTEQSAHSWLRGAATPPAMLSLALRQLTADWLHRPRVVRDPKWGANKLKRFHPDELHVGMRVGDAANKFASGEILSVSTSGGRCHVRWTAHDGTIKETRRAISGLKRLPETVG